MMTHGRVCRCSACLPRQVVQSQLASDFGPDAFLADEALDGSGSGDSPVWRQHGEIDDDEDGQDRDDDDDEASGSGMGPPTTIGTVSCVCTRASICISIMPSRGARTRLETPLSDESCVRRVSSVVISDRTSFAAGFYNAYRMAHYPIHPPTKERREKKMFPPPMKERELVQFNYASGAK